MMPLVRQSICLLMALVLGLAPLAVAVAGVGDMAVVKHLSAYGHHASPAMAMDDASGMAGDCEHCTDQCCEQGVCSGVSCGACVAGILPGTVEVTAYLRRLAGVAELPSAVPFHPSVLYRPPRA